MRRTPLFVAGLIVAVATMGMSAPVQAAPRPATVTTVTDTFTLDAAVTGPSSGSTATVQLTVGSPVPTGTVSIRWRLFDEADPGTDLDSGLRSVPSEGTWALSLSLPVGLAEGTYQLELVATADPGDGEVSATVQTPLVIDKTGPVVDASVDFATFFPTKDNYRDKATITATSAESVRYDVWVKSEDGSYYEQFRHMSARAPGEAAVVPWNGKDNSNTALPAGNYTLEVRAFDAVNNMTVTEFPVTLDLAATKTLTWGAGLAPATRLDSSFVGRCSALASPSDRGWAGSLGLYSADSCASTKKRADDVVVTHSKKVPVAVDGQYLSLKVAVWAGQGKGAAGSTAKLTYVDAKGAKHAAGKIKGKLGWTDGDTVAALAYITDVAGDPFVVWQLGVQKGSRVDVRRYALTLEYVALVEPDGTVITPPA